MSADAPLAVLVDGEPAGAIPVTDRGFLYGDALFEVLRTYGGRPAFLDEHLDRMSTGGTALAFGEPLPRTAFEADVRTLAAVAADVVMRLYWTSGDGAGMVRAPTGTRRVSMAFALTRPDAVAYDEGVDCIVLPGRATHFAAAKVAQYATNVSATRQARGRGAHEALLENAEGLIEEGATSNFFFVRDGILSTPPLGAILPGITRAKVLALAGRAGVPVAEVRPKREDLLEASELFLTSSVREVLPVRSLDGHFYGPPGPVARRLAVAYGIEARG